MDKPLIVHESFDVFCKQCGYMFFAEYEYEIGGEDKVKIEKGCKLGNIFPADQETCPRLGVR